MIICAAIRVKAKATKEEIHVCGLRHGDCYTTLRYVKFPQDHTLTEGFVTHENVFLDRKDAFCHACACGQLSPTVKIYKTEHGEDELYSEDLW